MDVNEWYKLLQVSIKNLEKYVMENYPMGISFTGSNDNWDLILDGKPASSTNEPKQEPPKRISPSIYSCLSTQGSSCSQEGSQERNGRFGV